MTFTYFKFKFYYKEIHYLLLIIHIFTKSTSIILIILFTFCNNQNFFYHSKSILCHTAHFVKSLNTITKALNFSAFKILLYSILLIIYISSVFFNIAYFIILQKITITYCSPFLTCKMDTTSFDVMSILS